jgi:hypothetical protein
MDPLPEDVLDWLEKNIMRYPNVVMFSRVYQPKIKNNKVTNIKCVRVYVKTKIKPASKLNPRHIIPAEIMSIPTDVIDVEGELNALNLDKTRFFRPVPLGVSVGSYEITAGTLGFQCEKNGELYLASNAHVLCGDPSEHSEDVSEKRILQPGPYHLKENGLNVDDPKYVAGEYFWHKRIFPVADTSNCEVASAIAKIYNFIASLFKARTRLIPIVHEVNNIDFAVYLPKVDHENKYLDITAGDMLVGLLFAGSDKVGLICKAKYFEEEGFKPLNAEVYEPELNDEVYGSSFWCNYTTKVVDVSAEAMVNYGTFQAVFRDIIVVDNDNVIRGGWSGTAFWLKKGGN